MAPELASLTNDASPTSEGLPPSLVPATISNLPKGAIAANWTTIRMSELHQRLVNCSESDADWSLFKKFHRVRARLSPDAFPDLLVEQPPAYLDS
jgi:FAD synthase